MTLLTLRPSLKFRVWGETWPPFEPGQHTRAPVMGMFEIPFGESMYYYEEGGMDDFPDDWTVMQATGFRDMNGVDIFESDLVLAHGTEHRATEAFRIDWWQQGASFVIVTPKGDRFSLQGGFDPQMLEVVGNIFESADFQR